MGKSQTRRLREATKRFGREDWSRLASTRANLSVLIFQRKKEAGLISPATTVARTAYSGPALVKRYSSSLTYQENVNKFGSPWK